ncbi:MAG: endo-1,4-beta-xylanase [Bacteroidales bacterium]|nr:endo-1,4-beta-xylanase [Bacteroidales bacterium]
MRRLLLALCLFPFSHLLWAQAIPTRVSEDTAGVMSTAYWEIWNDAEQARIDADIDAYRKANASFKVGAVKRGTKVKVEQTGSEFIFGASAFNWNQLGTPEANARYRELFGTLFNRATIPFYWKDFERKPGSPRYKEGYTDTEEWWNQAPNPMRQPHWRRPPTDPIVQWCEEHHVKVHGHPLVWGIRKWQYPEWMQYDGIPADERAALDSLEIMVFIGNAASVPSYQHMSPEELSTILPTYVRKEEERTLQRVRDIMGHYEGRIDSWDVVNESAQDFGSGSQDPSKPVCKSRYGIMFSDYTFKSFRVAEECNSWNSLLNINDYVVDERYVNQVGNLLKRGAKIDVLGSQMHLFQPQQCLDIASGKHLDPHLKLVDPAPIRAFFSKLGAFGIPTCLSEITITSAGDGERGEMIQAIIARNLYRIWFSLPSMMGITWWNIVDNCGAPGEPNISGLFHRDMTPKTAYYALDQLINHEWRTSLELQPRKGTVSWRGFKGTYRISWTDTKGKEHSEIITVK